MTLIGKFLVTATLFITPATSWAGAESPFEMDVRELDKAVTPVKGIQKASAGKRSHEPAIHKPQKPQALIAGSGYTPYTIKNGDHIFKILIKHFGVSNAAAEALIPEILRINGIRDFRRLSVGQTILIPAKNSSSSRHQEREAAAPAENNQKQIASTSPVSIAVRSITGREPEGTLDAILNIIPAKWSKDRILETSGGARNVPRFSVKVDRYLVYNGRRFIVSITNPDPFTYTLYRLLEVDGYTLIRLNTSKTFADIVSTTLSALKIPYHYGEHPVVLNDKNHTATSVKGFLFTKDTIPPRMVLVSENAVAALTAEMELDKDNPSLK